MTSPVPTPNVLSELAETIRARRSASAEKSYTRQLLEKGTLKCAKKFGEEAVELCLAAAAEDDAAVLNETADVLFHMLVLLESRGVALDDVMNKLAERQGTSGLVEKAARAKASG